MIGEGDAFAQSQNDGGTVKCFVYHRFGDDRYPSTNIPLSTFESHLQYLKNNNYTVLTLGEALHRLGSSSHSIPSKTAVITIDDGYQSVLTGAVPLLKKYNYRATLFICTSYVGNGGYLSWEELRHLQKQGFEIGNHSHSHTHFLNKAGTERATIFEKDLEQAERLFQEKLGQTPDLYAYPYGEYDSTLVKVLKEKGYEGAAAQKSGVIYPRVSRYILPRFPMTGYYGKREKFKEKIELEPLPVTKTQPTGVMTSPQSPDLQIWVEKGVPISPDNLQCFINGTTDCTLQYEEVKGQLRITVKTSQQFTTRRNLYTITAPGKQGTPWYWYTKLWVVPQFDEP